MREQKKRDKEMISVNCIVMVEERKPNIYKPQRAVGIYPWAIY